LPVRLEYLNCLEVIRKYLKFIKSEPFYVKNQDFL
jgi:hypothetical protein